MLVYVTSSVYWIGRPAKQTAVQVILLPPPKKNPRSMAALLAGENDHTITNRFVQKASVAVNEG